MRRNPQRHYRRGHHHHDRRHPCHRLHPYQPQQPRYQKLQERLGPWIVGNQGLESLHPSASTLAQAVEHVLPWYHYGSIPCPYDLQG